MALQDVRVYRGPDIASDDYLPVAMLKLKLKQRRSTHKRAQTFDVGKFKQPGVKVAFDIELSNQFAVLETVDSVEGMRSNFRNTLVQAAEKVVGYRRGTKKERWISDDTWKVINEEKDQATEVTGAANKRAGCRHRTRIQSKRQGS